MRDKVGRVREIYRSGGSQSLAHSASDFIYYNTINRIIDLYYRLLMLIDPEPVVECNGVRIDLSSDSISTRLKKKIRRGKYESTETKLIKRHLHPNSDVIELGAGVGYISAFVNMVLEDGQTQISVEADPDLVPIIERTKKLNDCDYIIKQAAYTSENGSVEFCRQPDFFASSLYRKGGNSISVESISLEAIVKEYSLDEFSLICDIEGGEFDLVESELELLSEKCTLIIIELHECLEKPVEFIETSLSNSVFKLVETSGDVYVFANTNNNE